MQKPAACFIRDNKTTILQPPKSVIQLRYQTKHSSTLESVTHPHDSRLHDV